MSTERTPSTRHVRRHDAPTGVTGPIATRWAVAGIQNRARGQTGKHRKRSWLRGR